MSSTDITKDPLVVFIIENFHKMSQTDIIRRSGRSRNYVRKRISELLHSGLISLDKEPDPALQEKEQYIIDNYSRMTLKEIADRIEVPYKKTRRILARLNKEGRIEFKRTTVDRKTDDKIEFIVKNHKTMSREDLAHNIGESLRWVKRQISNLQKSNKLEKKAPIPERVLSENDWDPQIKKCLEDLIKNKLKSLEYICRYLKHEYGIDLKKPALHYWSNKFGYSYPSKPEWLDRFLPVEKAESLLNSGLKIVDISKYIKDTYDVYVTDDMILTHIKKLGLKSQRQLYSDNINRKSDSFTRQWYQERIDGHVSIHDLSKEVGVSTTVVRKKLRFLGIGCIPHRKIWSNNFEILRDQLLSFDGIEGINDDDLHQMILGWLLGDGHLDVYGRFVTNHSLLQLDYLYLKYRVLKKWVSNVVTVPRASFSGDGGYIGGKEQMGISCPGMKDYVRYLNDDGSKNYERMIQELKPLGWACYFMDDGSYMTDKVIIMHSDLIRKFEYKYNFGKVLDKKRIEIKDIDPQYVIPGMAGKLGKHVDGIGLFWKQYLPEMFRPVIDSDFSLCFLNNFICEKNQKILNSAVEYYHKRGFPYFSISEPYLKKEFHKLSRLNTKYLWKDESTLRYIDVGNLIFKNFMPHMVKAKYRGVSPIDIFNGYTTLNRTIQYTLRSNKSALPDFLHNSLVFFNGGVVGFSCGIMKALVDRYCPSGGLVVDPCAGWGGRMLGTVSSGREYVGFEPWKETYDGLSTIASFYDFEVDLRNTRFDRLSAPEDCDLILTSPPYVDLEVYGDRMDIVEWKELIKNITLYAESSLKSGGYLILNLPRELKEMVETKLIPEKSVYWHTSSRKKDVKKAEILYIWRKPFN